MCEMRVWGSRREEHAKNDLRLAPVLLNAPNETLLAKIRFHFLQSHPQGIYFLGGSLYAFW